MKDRRRKPQHLINQLRRMGNKKMRPSRVIRDRVRAKNSRIQQLRERITTNAAHVRAIQKIMVTGFKQTEEILQDHQRKLEVLSYKAGWNI